jgi:Uma2 family endonuclease
MSFTPARAVPVSLDLQGFYRLSVADYRKIRDAGIFRSGDPFELLEGFLVNQPRPNSPRVASTRTGIDYRFLKFHADGWCYHGLPAITLADSEPEPDFAIVRGDLRSFPDRHPGPSDVGIVAEVSEWSLAFDRSEKGRIYARAGLPTYWIVNVIDAQVEVYTDPDLAGAPPAYRTRTDYRLGEMVPIVLDGRTVDFIPADDLLPVNRRAAVGDIPTILSARP